MKYLSVYLLTFLILLSANIYSIDRTKKISKNIILEAQFTGKVDNPKARKPNALFNRQETKAAAKRGTARKAVAEVVDNFLEKVGGSKTNELREKHKEKLEKLIYDEFLTYVDSYEDTEPIEEDWLNVESFEYKKELKEMDKKFGWWRWKSHTASDDYGRLGHTKKKRTVFAKNIILKAEYNWTVRLDKVQKVLQNEIRIDGGSKLQSLKVIVDFRNELEGEASYKMTQAEKTAAVETLEASLKEDDFTVIPLEIVIDNLKTMLVNEANNSSIQKEKVKDLMLSLEGKGKSGFQSSNAGYKFLQNYSDIVMSTRVAITKGKGNYTATLRIKAYTTPSIKYPAIELAGSTTKKESILVNGSSDLKSSIDTIIKRASAKASSALKVNIRDYYLKRNANREASLKNGTNWTIRLTGGNGETKEEVFSSLSRGIRRKIFRKMDMDDDSYNVDDTTMEIKFIWKGKIFKFEDKYLDLYEDHEVLGKLGMKIDKAQRVIYFKIK